MTDTARVCFKCNGSLLAEPGIDGDDTVVKCLSCGRIQPTRQIDAPFPKENKAPADWRAAALAEYRGILTELQRVTDLREQAARLRQGLIALGLTNVPELPGNAAKAVNEKRNTPAWTPEEDEQVRAMKANGTSARVIGTVLSRTPSSVDSRFTALKKRDAEALS